MSEVATGHRTSRGRRYAVPVVAVILAALAGGVLLWTVKGHQTSPSAVPVAIVNNDQPVTTGSGSDQKTIAAGRLLAANLSQPTPENTTPLSWQLMDADDAATRLQDGSYYGVLTIPQDFSAAITSTSGTSPLQAKLQLVTNDSASAAVGALAQLTVNQAALTLGDQVTSSYVDQLLQSMTSIHNSLTSSAGSAQTLGQLQRAARVVQPAAGRLHRPGGERGGQPRPGQQHPGGRRGHAVLGRGPDGDRCGPGGAGDEQPGDGGPARSTRAPRTAGRRGEAGHDRAAGGHGANGAGRTRRATSRPAWAGSHAEAGRHADTSAASPDRARGASRTTAPPPWTRSTATAWRCWPPRAGWRPTGPGRCAHGRGESERSADRRGRPRLDGPATANAGSPAGPVELSSGAAQVSSGADAARALPRRPAGRRRHRCRHRQPAGGHRCGADVLGRRVARDGRVPAGQRQRPAGQRAAPSSPAGQTSWPAATTSWRPGSTNGAQQVPSYTDDQRSALVTVVTTPVGVGSSADNPATVAASLVPVVLGLVLWLGTLMLFLTGPPVPSGLRVVPGVARAAGPGALAAGRAGRCPPGGDHHRGGRGQRGLDLLAAGAGRHRGAGRRGLRRDQPGAGGHVRRRRADGQPRLRAIQAAAFGGLVPIETAPAVLQTLNGILPLPQFVAGACRFMLGGGGDVVGPCLTLVGWTAAALVRVAAVHCPSRDRSWP